MTNRSHFTQIDLRAYQTSTNIHKWECDLTTNEAAFIDNYQLTRKVRDNLNGVIKKRQSKAYFARQNCMAYRETGRSLRELDRRAQRAMSEQS